MVSPAQRDCELVADLEAETARIAQTADGGRRRARGRRRGRAVSQRTEDAACPAAVWFRGGSTRFCRCGSGSRAMRRAVQFGWLVVVLIRCRLDLGELGPKRLSDLVSICRSQGICLRPRAQCPGIQIVLGSQSCDLRSAAGRSGLPRPHSTGRLPGHRWCPCGAPGAFLPSRAATDHSKRSSLRAGRCGLGSMVGAARSGASRSSSPAIPTRVNSA